MTEKRRLYMKDYYIKNRTKILTSAKKWHSDNYVLIKEKRAEYCKEYYINNREAYRISSRKSKKNNSATINAQVAKRRALKLQRTPKWLTMDQLLEIKQFYIDAKELSWLSEDKLTVDHIVPLQGERISGLHVPWNLQILPGRLNSAKHNKF